MVPIGLHMRPILLILMLVASPLPATNLETGQEESASHHIWIIESESVWTSEERAELEELGIRTLRQPTPHELLVWTDQPQSLSGIVWTEWYGTSLDIRENIYLHRIVLEPRLLSDDVQRIVREISEIGMFGFERVVHPDLPIGTEFEIIAYGSDLVELSSIQGIRSIHPVLETEGRDTVVSSIMEHGEIAQHPAWNLGLNGSGVIIAVADSGLDLDHSCFRNTSGTVGTPGPDHRKVIHINTSIDDWDDDITDFGHGTHVAGILGCREVDDFGGHPSTGMASMSHASMLLIQDVVDGSDWKEPEVDYLLAEAFEYGAVIHSDSWGDVDESYTPRSALFDRWSVEVPWSLAFIAPGNNRAAFYEPANARNVVAVGGSTRDAGLDVMSSSARGPSEDGLRGIFVVAPGVGIESAGSDGEQESFNNASRTRTGTSFSTPAAASWSAVVQQMVQDGWISGAVNRTNVVVHSHDSGTELNVSLANGSVPSGALLRSLMVIASDDLEGGLSAGDVIGPAPDIIQGWGRPNLSRIVDLYPNDTVHDPSPNLWIHDSFAVDDSKMFAEQWLGAEYGTPIEQVLFEPWTGEGADGPFLALNESVSWDMKIKEGEDVSIALSFNPRPFGDAVDNLDLIVSYGEEDRSSADPLEATEVVKIPAEDLVGISSIHVSVVASAVGAAVPGWSGSVGNAGDRLGFALAASGVYRDNVTLNLTNDEMVCYDIDSHAIVASIENQADCDAAGMVWMEKYSHDNHAEEDVWGCIISSATNYNPNATRNDGSCYYAPPQSYPGYSAPNGNYNDGGSTLPPIGGGNILGDSWLSKLPEKEEIASICFMGCCSVIIALVPFLFIKPKKKDVGKKEENSQEKGS